MEAGNIPWLDAIEQLPVLILTELAASPRFAIPGVRSLLTSVAYFVDAIVSPTPLGRASRDWPRSSTGWLFRPASLAYEVFGSPFRPVALDPEGLTSAVTALAHQVVSPA